MNNHSEQRLSEAAATLESWSWRLAEAPDLGDARLVEDLTAVAATLRELAGASPEAPGGTESGGPSGLVESVQAGIWQTNAERVITYANESMGRMLGYSAEEMVGRPVTDFLFAEDESRAAHIREQLRRGEVQTRALRLRHRDGHAIPVLNLARAQWEPDGTYAGILGASMDVTAQYEAEREQKRLLTQVQEERQRLFAALNMLPGYVCLLTPDYHFRFVNQRFIDLFGDPGESLCYAHLFGRETPCENCQSFHCLQTGEPQNWEWLSPVGKTFDIYDYEMTDADGSRLVLEVGLDITERRQAEAEREQLLHDLGVERALLQAVFDQAPLGIIVGAAPSGKLVLRNAEVERIFRHPFIETADIEGYRAWQGRHEDGRPYEPEEWPLARALAEGEVVREEEVDIVRGDGTVGTIAINAAPVRDAEGQITAAIVAFSDISYRRWAEQELREYQEHLEALVDERTRELEQTANQLAEQYELSEAILKTAATLITVLDAEGRIVKFNRACEETTGYSFEEVRGRPFWDFLLLPEEAAGVRDTWHELVNNLSNRYENHWITRTGERRLIAFNNSVLLGPDGTVEYVIASGLDITEHRALERAMEQAAAYNRSLIEVSLDPLVTIAPDGKITDVNSATERATGRTREELVGTDFSDYFTDPERAREGYEQVFRDGQVTDYELGLVRRDGHVTPVLYNACVYREAGGEVAGVFAAARDITRQREIENALRESEAKYRSLVEEANVVVLNVDSAGTITYMNPFALHFFGYTQEEVLGRNVLGTILAPQDSGGRDMAEMSEAILRGVREHGYNENENVTKDGRRVWMAWSNQPLYDAEGQIKGVLAIGVDRTAQKQAEEMLRGYRESLRSLASELALAEERERRRIAVGIHDQVSQTLALCKLRLGSLGRASSAEPAPEALAEVGNLLDQVISHTRTLTFELSPPILYELGLNSALEWMCETTTSKYGLPCYFEGHEGHLPLAQELGVVLFQGVRELLMNAAQHAQATQVKVSVGRAGQQVVITVADDGVGFDTTTLERAVGESQSFGLFNIRERLQYLGGHLEIESAPGQGTRATLTAPLAE